MATISRGQTLNGAASRSLDLAPVLVAILLATLFAGSIWAAASPKPMTDPLVTSMQNGL